AADLRELAHRLAEDDTVRVVRLGGNGRRFTGGGDIAQFSTTAPGESPATLRRMTDDYHLALARLTARDAPIVAGLRGAAAGGMRRLLSQSLETELRGRLAAEVAEIVEAAGTADAAEGIAAFAQRRRPRFGGPA